MKFLIISYLLLTASYHFTLADETMMTENRKALYAILNQDNFNSRLNPLSDYTNDELIAEVSGLLNNSYQLGFEDLKHSLETQYSEEKQLALSVACKLIELSIEINTNTTYDNYLYAQNRAFNCLSHIPLNSSSVAE